MNAQNSRPKLSAFLSKFNFLTHFCCRADFHQERGGKERFRVIVANNQFRNHQVWELAMTRQEFQKNFDQENSGPIFWSQDQL